MKNPNLKFIFGIILIVCGWIICFDIFLLIIGLAFFILGTILVMFSKKSLLVKSITVGIPILLWFIGFELILHEINKPERITILIPENFSGEFRIVEGEKNGIVPTEENGRTTLKIPPNGILISQAHLNLNQDTDFEYFFINGENHKTKLRVLQSISDSDAVYPAVLFNGMQSPPGLPGQSSNIPLKLDYVYDSFRVVTQPLEDGIDSALIKQATMINPLTDSLVKIERGIK
jgi:hypothetical protein